MGTFGRIIIVAVAIMAMTAEAMHHYPSEAEHRSFEAKMANGWPDSTSLWADIPTSQSFAVSHKWSPAPEASFNPLPNVQRKRQANGINFEQPSNRHPFGSAHFGQQPDFDAEPLRLSRSPYLQQQPPKESYDYHVQYEEVPRSKRQQFGAPSPPSSSESRFNRPDFGQFRPTDFGQSSSSSPAAFKEQHERPIRHTSFPASSLSPSQEKDHDFKSGFDFKPLGKSHSYTTFEAPKLNSNFFVDHSSANNDFKRPPRASFPSPPQLDNFKPPTHGNHFPKFNSIPDRKDTRVVPSYPEPPENNNEENYEYFAEDGENEDFNFDRAPEFNRNFGGSADDIEGNPDYSGRGQNNADPFEFQGKEEDESYDHVNREEAGKYDVKNFRKPMKPLKYEREEPIVVENYGNSFGGVETFKGGYDSEDDAEKGIVRPHAHHNPRSRQHKHSAPPSVAENMYIENEPVDDYNHDGYYVPKENHYQRGQEQEDAEADAIDYGRYRRDPPTESKMKKREPYKPEYDKYF